MMAPRRWVGWMGLGLCGLVGGALAGACAQMESSPEAQDKGGDGADEPHLIASSETAKQRVSELKQRFVIRPERGPSPVLGGGVATGFERDGEGIRPVIAQELKKRAPKSATVELPARANNPVKLSDDTSQVAVTFALRGAGQAEVKVSDGLALYAGALGGADMIHRPHAEGTEDYVVFETKPEREEIAYDLDVSHVAGLRLVSNTLEFLDGGGAPRLRMSPPYVVDAHGDSHPATVAVEGCQLDSDPRGPWGRELPALGATRCVVRVGWEHVSYPAVVDPSWVTTGLMVNSQRSRHTATLLGTNKVLLSGGSGLSSAELYDPGTGTFSSTGAMAAVRSAHTATLLGSGKVLVVGGDDNSGPFGSTTAELYNPATGMFSSTGSMTVPRSFHTATLVSARVLIAGGGGANGDQASAETYDPGSGTFSNTGPMANARVAHTATLLSSGKVLVAGGFNAVGLSSAELYDPIAGTFSGTGSMVTARGAHTATLLSSGKVLVAGGSNAVSLSSAELYDPAVGTFSATGSLTAARRFHTATLLGSGRVLVTGGFAASYLSSAELYVPATGTFLAADSMTFKRAYHTATALGSGNVLAAGGASVSNVAAELFVYAGMACNNGADCSSGICNNGICCQAQCNPIVCSQCVAGTGACMPVTNATDPDNCNGEHSCDAAGVCKLSLGQACPGVGANCASGFCAGGVCCDQACNTACVACTAALNGSATDGTCGPIPAGVDDPNVCTGANTCNGAGACKKKLGQPCPGGNADCASGFCADGVCCDKACNTACVACTAALKGSGSDGTCGNIPADTDPHDACPQDVAFPASCKADGFCDGGGACRQYAPPTVVCGPSMCVNGSASGSFCNGGGACLPNTMDCAPYTCASGVCETACNTSADCAGGAFCAPDQTCEKSKAPGSACASNAECDTGFCVDGYCCNTSCIDECAACDVTGKEGTCSPVNGPPHGTRLPCTATGEECGGTCDGANVTECNYPGADVPCGTSSCESGSESSSACNNKGVCAVQPEKLCAPYTCGAKACKTTCAVDEDCSGGNECKPDGTCAPKVTGFTCSDNHTVVDADGNETPCDPYRCVSGLCNKTCSSVDDCVAPNICDEAGHCVPPSGGGNTDDPGGCGCRTAGDSDNDNGAWLAVLGLALAALRRRKTG